MALATWLLSCYAFYEMSGAFAFVLQAKNSLDLINQYRFFDREESLKIGMKELKKWRAYTPITKALDKLFREKIENKWERELKKSN